MAFKKSGKSPLDDQDDVQGPPPYSDHVPGPSSVGNYHTNVPYGIQQHPSVVQQQHQDSHFLADKRARSRFFGALLCGLGIYIFVGVFCNTYALMPTYFLMKRPTVPISDGQPVKCVHLDELVEKEEQDTVGVSFDIVPNDLVDSLEFFTRGAHVLGSLSFTPADDNQDASSDAVTVTVSVEYESLELLELTNVCYIEKEDPTTRGIKRRLGVYTPPVHKVPHFNSHLRWSVNVALPQKFLNLDSLEVTAPVFDVDGSLRQTQFSHLAIDTISSSISLDDATSDSTRLRTSNGNIRGSFNVIKGLSLATTNGNVDAKTNLITKTDTTERNHILHSNSSDVTVSCTSTNGNVNLVYSSHPPDRRLVSYVQSTNGDVSTVHQPSFEGDYELETSGPKATVYRPSDTEKDPSGKNRKRKLEIRNNSELPGFKRQSGTIWWSTGDKKDNDRRNRGDSTVRTTLGSAEIRFL